MNGSKYLFDTNAIIAYLKGSPFIDNLVNNADWLGISVISIIEFYSFKDLTDTDKTIFSVFCNRVEVIDISLQNNSTLIFQTAHLRTLYNLKLPDAVIGSSALINDAAIITNDQQFKKILNLQVINF
jgi:tRNA(fMet)-specific endonuclease VapC